MPNTKQHKPYRYFKKTGRKPINYLGKKYDDWVVIEKQGKLDKTKNPYWTLENKKTKQLIVIRQDHLGKEFRAKNINKVARKFEIPKPKKTPKSSKK